MPPQSNGAVMLRAVAPDPGLLAWLWSNEGQQWAEAEFKRVGFRGSGAFASVKYDRECKAGDILADGCAGGWGQESYISQFTRKEYEKYGLSGIPEEWRHWE